MSGIDSIIAGLGNPGSGYNQTRHNIGFLFLDSFAKHHGFSISSSKWHGHFSRQRLNDKSVVLLKPQTYMNRSGECVERFCDYYKVTEEKLLVLHDDIDLDLGRIKIIARGGAGGHNGVSSIISHLGTTDFARIKIGIGRPGDKDDSTHIPVSSYVLSRFTVDENLTIQSRLALVFEAIEIFLHYGVEAAMNQVNGRT